MRRSLSAAILAVVVLVTASAGRGDVQQALASITSQGIRAHLAFLSHDLLEGRAPATRGGELAARYIAAQLEAAGLLPVRGSYFQQVPLLGATVDTGEVVLDFVTQDGRVPARYGPDAIVWPGVEDAQIALDAEVVFVGYGVHAPEYDWDDFGDADLDGRILLMLVSDPPAPPDEPALFGGRAMSYYGRWTYKFEEAGRRGAAGALLIHTTDAAGYPWDVVRGSWSGEQLALRRADDAEHAVALRGWVTRDFADGLLARAGLNLSQLFVRAARRDFRPVSTGIRLEASVPSRIRHLSSDNVAALVPGRHPERRDEVVVYTAHYDHLGIGPPVDGDSIYNGAYDNASGVAVLIEIARAFARLDPGPDRSVLFLATTAEEAGLLGAHHYVADPLYPLRRTGANINIDGANVWGETNDVVALGADRSTMGAVVELRAEEMGLRLAPDRAPEKGFFFRSDQFAFARAGIPAVYLAHGLDFRDRPDGWGARTLGRYEAEHYHRPSDRYDPGFDLGGAVQQARLAFLVGYDVAHAAVLPRWHEGSEFKAAYDRLHGR